MSENPLDTTIETSEFLRGQGFTGAKIGVVLGSGWRVFAESFKFDLSISYSKIPHFWNCRVQGHEGMLYLGSVSGKRCLVMSGRAHLYEGLDWDEVTFPIRAIGTLGVKTLVVTNAAGGINKAFRVGDLMLISDHVGTFMLERRRLSFLSSGGESYCSMKLRKRAYQAAQRHGISLKEGVLLGMLGPSYETPAELEMARRIGVDAVTMSTIPEVKAAKEQSMDALGVSFISNLTFGNRPDSLDHSGVIAVSERFKQKMSDFLTGLVDCV